MALNQSDKSRILRRYFPGMTRNSEMSTEPRLPSSRRQQLQKLLAEPALHMESRRGEYRSSHRTL